MNREKKEEQLEFAKKLLDTSEGFYIQVGKPTFIMLIDIIAEQQKEIEEFEKYKRKHTLIKNHYISKDKIKAKIKEIEEKDKKYKHFMSDGREEFVMETIAIPILKELLGEENE